ncbi:NAD(P)/FAD-dependent oxidoreductase, partial [Candidatus Margulisiibacteriota bacterium]
VEEALFLTRYAKKVTIVHRRDQLRADKVYADQAAKNPKIIMQWNSTITEIKGKDRVKEVVVENTASKKGTSIKCDGVFIYVGSVPQTAFLKGTINLDENGFIVTTGRLTTSKRGVYVAGDVREKGLRQIVTAAADGAIAADEARKFIEEA